MKKLTILPALALLLMGCSNESILNENGKPDGVDNAATSFLHVALVVPTTSSTRAANPNGDGEYVNGFDYENHINNIRFFFFNANGTAAEVYKQSSANTYLSYIDWEPSDQGTSGTPGEDDPVKDENGNPIKTVEKIIDATLGINVPDGNDNPELVVAILNPSTEVYGLQGNPSLESLRTVVSDYYTGLHNGSVSNSDAGNFVITNSVYLNGTDIIDATHISAENFGDENGMHVNDDDEEVEAQTLVIYVERVLARLDFKVNLTNETEKDAQGNILYKVSEKTVGGESTDIYMKLLGWNITSVTSDSRLIKSIDAQWSSDLFGNQYNWNVPSYHRSFWAINPPADQYSYLFGDFGSSSPSTDSGIKNKFEQNYYPAQQYGIPGIDETMTVYMQENAAEYTGSATNVGTGAVVPTKVIMAAQLVDVNGKEIELAYWANRYYTQEGLLNAVANRLNLYREMTSADTDVENIDGYVKITPDDIEYVSIEELEGKTDFGPYTEDEIGEGKERIPQYRVTVQLTNDAKKITWYEKTTDTNTQFKEMTTVETNSYILNSVGNDIKVWTSGYCYYYINIRHLGDLGNPGYEGVVRNHIYDTTITHIEGLGTPVYDPDQVIYPQKPEYDDNVISTEVRVLQWRIVTQEYDDIKW